jgi:anaphase-promoting complex subunit 1
LYVLAVENRCLDIRDVDTGLSVYVPVVLEVADPENTGGTGNGQTWVEMVTPCLLPELRYVKSVCISSPRYWPRKLVFSQNSLDDGASPNLQVYVKRKSGYLPYVHDPSGYLSLLSRSFSKASEPNLYSRVAQTMKSDFIRSFSQDPNLLAFAKHFCEEPEAKRATVDEDAAVKRPASNAYVHGLSFSSFCTAVLYECLTRDKPEMLQTYLALYLSLSALDSDAASSEEATAQSLPLTLWNIKLLLEYYNHHNPGEDGLIQPTFLLSIDRRIRAFFDDRCGSLPLVQYVQTGCMPTEERERLLLAAFLSYYQLPHPQAMRRWLLPDDSKSAPPSLLGLATLAPGISPAAARILLHILTNVNTKKK